MKSCFLMKKLKARYKIFKKVNKDFEYNSGVNKDFLSVSNLKNIIEKKF